MPGKDQPPDRTAAPRPPAASVLAVFRRHAPLGLAGLAVVLGALSGLANTGLIAIINHALSAVRRPGASWVWIFAGLCVVAGIARVFSATLVVQVGARLATELQVSLSRRILAAPLRLLEEIGSHRLLASLVDDVNTVSDAITIVPTALINSIVVLGCLAYLGWLSPSLLGGVLVVMAIGVLTYQLALNAGYARQRRAREMADELFRHLRGLTLGTKELKTSRRRREDFIDLLEISAQRFRGMRVTAQRIFNVAASWGNLLFFLAIGLILLLPSGTGLLLGHETRNGFVLVLLYMSGPLQAVLNSVPMVSQSAVALQKIESLGISLFTSEDIRPATAAEQKPSWQRLELVGATHTYVRDDGAFTLGPLDLAFEPGELIFVVGGNGSGKTTFAKLLVGLYLPEAGEIRLNGKPVQAEQLDAYRHLFAIVFSDFYLFEKLLGLSPTEMNAAAGYVAKLRLAHQVRIQNGAFSTTALSQGQRKRLALIAALLEDRAMYVFDEWAADQDPEFKVFFYCQILPELMARGKTVFVITHDDRFFDLASRVVKLEDGQVVSDRVPHAVTPLASIPAKSK